MSKHPWAGLFDAPASRWDRLAPDAQQAAITEVMRVFDPALTTDHDVQRHPLLHPEWRRFAHPSALVELGVALRALRPDETCLRRLRDPREFPGARAELRTQFMFARAGARLEVPDRRPGEPSWDLTAFFGNSTTLAIEVKQARPSSWDELLGKGGMRLALAAQKAPDRIREALGNRYLIFHLSPDAIEAASEHGQEGVDVATQFFRVAWPTVLNALQTSRVDYSFELGVLGHVQVSSVPPAVQDLDITSTFPQVPPGVAAERIRQNLYRKAKKQVGRAPYPGLILVEISDDLSAANKPEDYERWAATTPRLAALIFTADHWDEVSSHAAWIFPGPEYAGCGDAIESLFERCSRGHWHFSPLSSLPKDCKAPGLFRASEATSSAESGDNHPER